MEKKLNLMSIPSALVCDRLHWKLRREPSISWTGRQRDKGEYCAKDYVLVEVELTAIGYMQKTEAGILVKSKPMSTAGWDQ
jgi:hypothetical protein